MKERRKYKRSTPQDKHLIELQSKGNKKEHLKVMGLVRDESFHGVCGVFRKPFPFRKDEELTLTVGNMKNIHGHIKWIDDLDQALVKVGLFFYIDD
ncbi:MAG: hypothetical protein JW827_03715 [Spirochaetes bacterium]|nr:hypothetical protein [Spirochaetota bacterium]